MKFFFGSVCVLAGLLLSGGVCRAVEGDNIHCGAVVDVQFVARTDFELEWQVPKFKEEPTLEEGQKFIIITVELDPKMSIGKYDYTFGGSECLAMALDQGIFDPLNWQYLAKDLRDTSQVRMLYIVNEDEAPFWLNYTYGDEITTHKAEEIAVQLTPHKAAKSKDDEEEGEDDDDKSGKKAGADEEEDGEEDKDDDEGDEEDEEEDEDDDDGGKKAQEAW